MIAIDFFCGGGGLTSGLIGAGISVLGGYDSCPDYKDTYEKNNRSSGTTTSNNTNNIMCNNVYRLWKRNNEIFI